jgi:hypothetical protein
LRFVIEVAGFLDGVLDDLLGPRRLRELAHSHHVGTGLHQLLDLEADLAEVNVEVLQDVGTDTGALLHEPEQNMLRPDVLVVEPLGFLVGQGHHFSSPIGESFEHHNTPMVGAIPTGRRWRRKPRILGLSQRAF